MQKKKMFLETVQPNLQHVLFHKEPFLHKMLVWFFSSNISPLVNVQGSVKIRLACSKALLITISSSNIVTHSNGYIKGDKYFFFL